MTTRIRKKAMTLAFEPTESNGHSFTVSTGTQKLGRVSYIENEGKILVTNLEIEPYLQGLSIEAHIINALLADDTVKSITVLADLSMTIYYQEDGFVCEPKQVLLTKTKA